jgi:hypothetical protein
MQTMGVDWCFSALGKKPVNKRCITKYNGISICLCRTPSWALHPQSQTQIFEEMLQRSLNGALNEPSSNWCVSISSLCTTRDHFYLKSQENLLLKVWRDKNYCTRRPVAVDFALQILGKCESQAAEHVYFWNYNMMANWKLSPGRFYPEWGVIPEGCLKEVPVTYVVTAFSKYEWF